MAKSVWRIDESGRLLTPSGAFVARLEGGRLFFFDRKRRVEEETPFTLGDWWQLMERGEWESGREGEGETAGSGGDGVGS